MSTQSRTIRIYNEWMENAIPGIGRWDVKEKDHVVNYYIKDFLNRTLHMFKWEGLPETIPARSLELYLQCNGNTAITDINGDLFAFTGGLGGEPDPYYMPTIYTIANPALNVSKNLKIDKDCIVIPNDSCYMGLLPKLTKHATALTETELTLYIAKINNRISNFISAADDRSAESARQFLQDIEDGKQGIIAENAFIEGIKTHEYTRGTSDAIMQMIELYQYEKANLFLELGLSYNYNMKREAINGREAALGEDTLRTLTDDMLKMRQEGAEKVNELYGTNISVDYDGAWKDNIEELEAELEALENETETDAEDAETPTDEQDENKKEVADDETKTE